MRFYADLSRVFPPDPRIPSVIAALTVSLCVPLFVSAAPLSNMVQAEGLSPELTELVGTLLGRTKTMRGLSAKGIIRARSASRQELISYMDTQLADPAAKRQLELNQEMLKVIGAIKPDSDVLSIMRSFMAEQVAGYYDWKQKILYMADWIPQSLQSFTLLHELTHALQDQHFGLERLIDASEGISEPYAAAQSLMEGDATLITIFGGSGGAVDSRYIDMAANAIKAGDTAMPGQESSGVPRVISESLMFPYTDGLSFVLAAFRAGGDNWSVVDRLYTRLPLSTEQIIHPEKCLSEQPDFPREVRVRGITALMSSPDGYGTDVFGESGFRVIFRDLMPRARADRAAAGWDGDRYFVWRDAVGNSSAVLASVWDSPEDAQQAAEAIRKTGNRPAAVLCRGDRMVAVWRTDSKKASSTFAGKVMRAVETVEVKTWDGWLKEARVSISRSVLRLR